MTTNLKAPERRAWHPQTDARTAVRRYPVLQIVALVALVAWGAATVPAILQPISIISILVLASLLGLASIGQTLVTLLGGLDLAIPGYIAVGAFSATTLAGEYHWPLGVALLVAVAVGGIFGLGTGYLCFKLRIQPLVVTLGTGSILAGAVLILNGGSFISAPPAALNSFVSVTGKTFGLPIPPVISVWIIVTVAVAVLLSRTGFGRRFYATGANPTAASFTRINAGTSWAVAFGANGALTALAGVLIAGFANGSTADIGDPYLYSGLAAVFVGGTAFGAVHGSYTRTVLGALILTILSTVLVGDGFSSGQSTVLYGLIILVVVALYGRERRLRDRL